MIASRTILSSRWDCRLSCLLYTFASNLPVCLRDHAELLGGCDRGVPEAW